MSPEILLAFLLFALVSSITPGPNNLMLMASGVNFGFARTLPHLLGVNAGFVTMVLLVGIGLSRVFTAFPLAHDVLRGVSAAYLLWLAWKVATAAPPSEGEAAGRPLSFVQAALFQWVNPKAWAMSLTAVTAFSPSRETGLGLVVIALAYGAVNLPCVSAWTLLGVQLRRVLHNRRTLRTFNVAAALALVATLYPILLPAV